MARMECRLVVAQTNPVLGDLRANLEDHLERVEAALGNSDLILFPELSLTGYELDAEPVDPGDPALRPLVDACAAAAAVALAGAPVDEDGRRAIAALRVDGDGVAVAYRKTHLGGEEPARFAPGDGPAVLELDGRRVGIGICKDTGQAAHVDGVAALGPDLYVAGLVHGAHERAEQDRRGTRIAAACGCPVAFASFAGPTGHGYGTTAGTSTIWDAAGRVLARAGDAPGEVVAARVP